MARYKFVNPLVAWVSAESDRYRESNYEILHGLDEINEAIAEDIPEETGLAEYIHEEMTEIFGKVQEIRISVMELNGEAVGVATVITDSELSAKGIEEMKDYLTGQYADGWGEGFEQREVDSWTETVEYEEYDEEEGEYYTYEVDERHYLYVSFWDSDKDWKIDLLDDIELKEVTPRKPVCRLIGQDGNIFNLLGLAKRELNRANQRDRGNEMASKVYQAQSYSEALRIIGEYVEIR